MENKLLIVTQKVDLKDPILGFFHEWINRLSLEFQSVTVICLQKGEYKLSKNVHVFSLGKEKNLKNNDLSNFLLKVKYVLKFYKIIWRESKNYNKVFVHMNQEYVLLGGLFWKLCGKKIFLWRNHSYGNWLTRIAVFLSDKVFCTSPFSYTAKFKKTKIMPVGVDTDFFKPSPGIDRMPNTILFIGRIAPIKKVSEFIDWLKDHNFSTVTIAGGASEKNQEYEKEIREKISLYGMSEKVLFVGPVDRIGALKLMRSHETCVNLTPAGSMDKSVLEAAACGMKIKVANPDLKKLEKLNEKQLRDYVVQNHSLKLLTRKLLEHDVSKNILMVINNLTIGGAERLFVDQVNELEKLGYCVHAIILDPSLKVGFSGDLKFFRGKKIEILKNSNFKKILAIRKILRKGEYSVVISHLFLANTLTRVAKILAFSPVKVLAYEHNTYEKEKKLKHLLIDLVLSLVSFKIIAVSPFVRDFLEKKWIPKKKIVVVENGVSITSADSVENDSNIRSELGVRDEETLIVSTGNVNSQKGYETLIDTSYIISRKHSGVKFVVCGLDTGAYAKNLKNIVLNKKLENNFNFLGARLDAVDIVRSADLFVMCSHWEGLSISLLEAMLLGKVIIVSNIPSFTRIIKNGYNGLTFQVDNPQHLAKLIEEFIISPGSYRKYGENARLEAQQYSIKSNIKKLLELINDEK